jgi:hypothetical protein
MIITMDYYTFGKFMAAVAEMESPVSIKNLGIEHVNLREEPKRITIIHGSKYDSDSKI